MLRSRVSLFLPALTLITLCILYLLNQRFTIQIRTSVLEALVPILEKTTPTPATKIEYIYVNLSHTQKPYYNYVQRYKDVSECKIKYEPLSPDEHVGSDVQYLNAHLHETRLSRALVIYFPHAHFDDYIPQFRWLYLSWIEMQKYEPKKWRTDLLVFFDGTKENGKDMIRIFSELNCKLGNQRKSKDDPPRCVLIQYENLADRYVQPVVLIFSDKYAMYEYFFDKFDIFNGNENELYSKLKEITHYNFLDSILTLYDGYKSYADYDFVVRLDMDAFITPLFATWLPENCNDFVVGTGAYSHDFNVNRLEKVARTLSLQYANERNLGSTWYSTPKQVRLMSYLTLVSKHFLFMEEFAEPERHGRLGTHMWPEWHYGVTLLYGVSLAMNHMIATDQLNIVRKEKFLDHDSTGDDPVYSMILMHVYQHKYMFSKYQFKRGRYEKMSHDGLDITITKYYAFYMAMKSKRSSNSELNGLLEEQIKKKN